MLFVCFRKETKPGIHSDALCFQKKKKENEKKEKLKKKNDVEIKLKINN
jgi:hypothetical protein